MKVKTGKDEFCMHCMEWREYDNRGRCMVCHNLLVKKENLKSQGYNEYKTESSSYEYNDDTEEYQ